MPAARQPSRWSHHAEAVRAMNARAAVRLPLVADAGARPPARAAAASPGPSAPRGRPRPRSASGRCVPFPPRAPPTVWPSRRSAMAAHLAVDGLVVHHPARAAWGRAPVRTARTGWPAASELIATGSVKWNAAPCRGSPPRCARRGPPRPAGKRPAPGHCALLQAFGGELICGHRPHLGRQAGAVVAHGHVYGRRVCAAKENTEMRAPRDELDAVADLVPQNRQLAVGGDEGQGETPSVLVVEAQAARGVQEALGRPWPGAPARRATWARAAAAVRPASEKTSRMAFTAPPGSGVVARAREGRSRRPSRRSAAHSSEDLQRAAHGGGGAQVVHHHARRGQAQLVGAPLLGSIARGGRRRATAPRARPTRRPR